MNDDRRHGLGCLPPTFDARDQDYHFATLGLPYIKAVTLPVQAPLPPYRGRAEGWLVVPSLEPG